ncbi:S-layer homology domain-containing protein [Paenibacillus sp. HB172176]|uniref:S-layer homology domain-containing protein n=1 Tax=Paenibacillus sp. HB172176 TaxID=2493690 RepID=UPI00143BF68D|nr:S-layer homology domain-containing protein [Paenibacillus sp. HB172176]
MIIKKQKSASLCLLAAFILIASLPVSASASASSAGATASSYASVLGASAQAPPSSSQASTNEAAQIRMTWEETNGSLEVTIWGDKLEDVYAYELNLELDSSRLQLISSDMPERGFSLQPQIEGNNIKLVYTKTGNVSGESGSQKLAVLTFVRTRGGDAAIVFDNAALVDSKLERLDLTTDVTTILPASAGSLPLTDISGHWAESVIYEAVRQGWATGYEDGTFRPDRMVTRAELAVLLTRAFDLNLDLDASVNEPDTKQEKASGSDTVDDSDSYTTGDAKTRASAVFTDEADIPSWAKPHVAAAQAAGWLSGYEDGSFRASRAVSRAELSVVIARVLDMPMNSEPSSSPRFEDEDQIPAWASPAIAALAQSNIIRGRGGNRFSPLETATRAEVCALLATVMNTQTLSISEQ